MSPLTASFHMFSLLVFQDPSSRSTRNHMSAGRYRAKPELKRLEMRATRLLKKGMASAMTHPTATMAKMVRSQVAHPRGVLT